MAVDEFELTGELDAAAESAGNGGHSRPRGKGGPATWAIAAAALILIGSTTATPLYIPSAGFEFLLTDLDLRTEPEVAWEVPVAVQNVLGSTSDTIVIAEPGEQFGLSIVALDLATGAAIWTYEDHWNNCLWGDMVTCVDDPDTPAAAVVRIDRVSGIQDRVAHSGAITAIGYEGGLIAAFRDAAAPLDKLTRYDADGRELWTSRVDAADTTTEPPFAFLYIYAGSTTLTTMTGEVDLETGEGLGYSERTFRPLTNDESVLRTREGVVVQTPDGQFPIDQNDAVSPHR